MRKEIAEEKPAEDRYLFTSQKRRLAGPKNAARKSFPFGARKEKFTRHNEKNLASLFPKTRTA